ncbi:jasmonate-induced oxygenase 4-like [Salvia miltiorrhiza]|uniref:jasmonate-induced oxygenase 4-like n=1 Tax=Salvia miltiorrhiza TaxID=226208 RepID=UPI0025AD1079|nr:jasmonate-induced oxygenase 4-like [Salvia miltiorrhiza]
MAGDLAKQEGLGSEIDKDEQLIPLTVPLAAEIPVVDLRRLLAASTDAGLSDLRSALSSWGCFQVVNHGIESSVLAEVRRISREFFELPMSEKHKYAGAEVDQGYGTDQPVADDQFPDCSHYLRLRIFPEDRRNPIYWPQNPDSFREVLVEYSDKLRGVAEEILKLTGKSLKLGDEESFVKKTSVMHAQFNYYPPCPNPDRVIGLRQHSDCSVITILLQADQVEGLQLLKDDNWLAAPIMPHALFVFAGDQLQIMSNGILKSCVHRVVRGIRSEKERRTLAVFFSPNSAEEIGPLDELSVSCAWEGIVSGESPLFGHMVQVGHNAAIFRERGMDMKQRHSGHA